jgi:hypothetical protein
LCILFPVSKFILPKKCNYSGRGDGDCNAPRSYDKRWRNISRIGVSAMEFFKPDDIVAIYDK